MKQSKLDSVGVSNYDPNPDGDDPDSGLEMKSIGRGLRCPSASD